MYKYFKIWFISFVLGFLTLYLLEFIFEKKTNLPNVFFTIRPTLSIIFILLFILIFIREMTLKEVFFGSLITIIYNFFIYLVVTNISDKETEKYFYTFFGRMIFLPRDFYLVTFYDITYKLKLYVSANIINIFSVIGPFLFFISKLLIKPLDIKNENSYKK